MESFLVSMGVVALAEIGDKTQLLAFVLAARFRKPWPIIAGIFVATVANHGLAGALGTWITSMVAPEALRWLLGGSFIAMGLWTLVPDTLADDRQERATRWGVFGATLVAFFFVEMGDKTQIATVVLAAQYQSFASVVAGTTVGMMIANAPAVLVGERITSRIPVRTLQLCAAVIFVALGVATLFSR